MLREPADAQVVAGSSTFLVNRTGLAELATKRRLPAIYSDRENVEVGGLMPYAVHVADFIGRAAVYVDKIRHGAKPADLPVEQPARLERVINLRAAKSIGLTVPQSLLLRADELIQ
jgi:putative ABC transport system substrate-binding protein